MSPWGRWLLIGLGLWFFFLSPVYAQENPQRNSGSKTFYIPPLPKDRLKEIFTNHKLWLESNGTKGEKAFLYGANLKGLDLREFAEGKVNLKEAILEGADLSGNDLSYVEMTEADLRRANLEGAILRGANLSKAKLQGATLRAAILARANLSGAMLDLADMSGSVLANVDLSGAELFGANLSNSRFEVRPNSIPAFVSLLGIKGLDSLKFVGTYSFSLVKLREIYKNAGMRNEERQVTFSLNHTRREHLWAEKVIEYENGERKERWIEKGFLSKLESLFHLVFFEWTCKYGMSPGRPLQIMGLGLLLFIFPYFLALQTRDSQTGIWLLLPPDRVLDRKLKDRPYKLTSHRPFRPLPEKPWSKFKATIGRGWRALRLAFYFSLLSAFHLGWRDLNVGSWIARLQRKEYNLRATGWVRTVSGLQSLLSVYMLALWALSYFGRPFE